MGLWSIVTQMLSFDRSLNQSYDGGRECSLGHIRWFGTNDGEIVLKNTTKPKKTDFAYFYQNNITNALLASISEDINCLSPIFNDD